MKKFPIAVVLLLVLGACGDDDTVTTVATTVATTATTTTAPVDSTIPPVDTTVVEETTTSMAATGGVVDSFDGPPIGYSARSDFTLTVESGVAHFVAEAVPALGDTSPDVLYPPESAFAQGDITLRFAEGAVTPTHARVGFWRTADGLSYAEVSVSFFEPTMAAISWYDGNVGVSNFVDLPVPDGAYRPGEFNTLVIHVFERTVAVELNGQSLGEAFVPLASGYFGTPFWGTFPRNLGGELIVDEFIVQPY